MLIFYHMLPFFYQSIVHVDNYSSILKFQLFHVINMNDLLLNILQKLKDLLCISPYTIFNEEKITSRTCFQVGAQFLSISPDA